MNREQLKTIFWLRWRLTRNQWMKSGGIGAIIAVIVGFGAFMLGGLCFTGALLGAAFGLKTAPTVVVMGIWFGITVVFLFFWMIGLLTELQRSETIDLQRLMHLPVALGQMFVVNYLASHFAASIIIMVPAMVGLAIGLVIARGPEMALLIPLALSMVFMITAWTYCLRGWLAAMMTNPRRRRTVIMVITLSFVLVGQAPNIYFNVFQRHNHKHFATDAERQQNQASEREEFNELVAAQKYIPPLWVPFGARALTEKNPLPALLGTLGCFIIGALGLRRTYKSTLRFYHGESGGQAAAQIKSADAGIPVAARAPVKGASRFLELRLPIVPEQAAALALATFRSMLRAPEVKMAWATSFIVTVIVCVTVLFRNTNNVSETLKPFAVTGVAAFSIFLLVQFLANTFGFDRDGFRALILSPAERRFILLGKNLANLPVGLGFGILLITIVSIRLHVAWLDAIAALFQLGSLLLIASLAGNLLSIFMPYRIQPGSMKPTKMPGLVTVTIIFCQLLFPVAMSPIMMPPLAEFFWRRMHWPDFVPINFLLSAILATMLALIYWWSLEPFGRMLQRRETKILSTVTVEVE